MNPEALPDRIRSKFVIDEAGCWIWIAALDRSGYGRVNRGSGTRQTVFAHRLVYQLLVDDPGDLELDHLCRVPRCVNPDHLEPVTHLENVRRGRGAEATRARYSNRACPQGHPLSGPNLYAYHAVKNGHTYINKMCRTCRRESDRRRRSRVT